jgi:single-strand DNA-binding protein
MFSELCRIGRDTELRYTSSGKAVCNVVMAYDIGFGDNKRTAWIEGSLWEKRAEAMAQYLVKGSQVFVVMTDLEAEAYTTGTGEARAKIKGRIVEIKFAGPKSDSKGGSVGRPRAEPDRGSQAHSEAFDDDTIPF